MVCSIGSFCNAPFFLFHRMKIYTGMELSKLNNIQKPPLSQRQYTSLSVIDHFAISSKK